MKMVARACPICGTTGHSRVFALANINIDKLDSYAFASRKMPEYMHHRLLACGACDVLYASPVPSVSELSQAYHDASFDSGEEARWASRTYAGFLPFIMRRLPNQIGALDIGTGDGIFLEQLLAADFTGVIGVEPSIAPITSAKPEIRPLIKHDIFRPQDYREASFSLITCFQTIEHLSEPLEMCRGARKLLRQGGALFLIGHNRRSLSARLLGKKSPIFDIEHLQLFSPASARNLLERAGFSDIELRPVLNRYPLHYWLKLFPLPIRLKRALIASLKAMKVGYLPVPLPAGNIAVIGYNR